MDAAGGFGLDQDPIASGDAPQVWQCLYCYEGTCIGVRPREARSPEVSAIIWGQMGSNT
jgi:hypothetical protein